MTYETTYEAIHVHRQDITESRARKDLEARTLEDGEVRIAIDRLGLSANNISYAAAGDMLGYWAHFSTDPDWGVVPVWGFATVIESRCRAIPDGEQIFGFLPMASQHIFRPESVTNLCFADESVARASLHPWYRRLYRCAADPAFTADRENAQLLLWALFMTGWMMAEDLADGIETVYLSSASSKTALALAWALKHSGRAIRTVGLTSPGNRAFVEALNVYSTIATYDEQPLDQAAAPSAYVDFAGDGALRSELHVALGDQLKDSVLIGATHRAPADKPLPMPGPAPRFFFIPDVAEAQAKALGLETYHGQFARAWQGFADWATAWLQIESEQGIAAIEAGYQSLITGDVAPRSGLVYQWG
ncbi:MAG: DUF2855 family protein [Pseudomonadota bacterium]